MTGKFRWHQMQKGPANFDQRANEEWRKGPMGRSVTSAKSLWGGLNSTLSLEDKKLRYNTQCNLAYEERTLIDEINRKRYEISKTQPELIAGGIKNKNRNKNKRHPIIKTFSKPSLLMLFSKHELEMSKSKQKNK